MMFAAHRLSVIASYSASSPGLVDFLVDEFLHESF